MAGEALDRKSQGYLGLEAWVDLPRLTKSVILVSFACRDQVEGFSVSEKAASPRGGFTRTGSKTGRREA
jgi:hypothetical protein